MLIIYLQGLALGASLIIAIGAQNAFVLSQGIRQEHSLIIPLICSMTDAILIAIGVLGAGAWMASRPLLSAAASTAGALFLLWYGWKHAAASFSPKGMDDSPRDSMSTSSAVLFTLAVSLLNPHVYIDTIVLLGGISSTYDQAVRGYFAAGAVTASFLWFFSLSLGGRALSPIFKDPRAWKILDRVIAIIMWFMAYTLIKHGLLESLFPLVS